MVAKSWDCLGKVKVEIKSRLHKKWPTLPTFAGNAIDKCNHELQPSIQSCFRKNCCTLCHIITSFTTLLTHSLSTWTITRACLIFELLPFVYFHTWILSRTYLQNYTSYCYEILWVDRSHLGGVQCTWTVTLAFLIFELLPFVYFHTWILYGAYLKNYTSYGYEILWVDRSHLGDCSAHDQ